MQVAVATTSQVTRVNCNAVTEYWFPLIEGITKNDIILI
jgi:hypothetical protein